MICIKKKTRRGNTINLIQVLCEMQSAIQCLSDHHSNPVDEMLSLVLKLGPTEEEPPQNE